MTIEFSEEAFARASLMVAVDQEMLPPSSALFPPPTPSVTYVTIASDYSHRNYVTFVRECTRYLT